MTTITTRDGALIAHGDDDQIAPIGASAMLSAKLEVARRHAARVPAGDVHGRCRSRELGSQGARTRARPDACGSSREAGEVESRAHRPLRIGRLVELGLDYGSWQLRLWPLERGEEP